MLLIGILTGFEFHMLYKCGEMTVGIWKLHSLSTRRLFYATIGNATLMKTYLQGQNMYFRTWNRSSTYQNVISQNIYDIHNISKSWAALEVSFPIDIDSCLLIMLFSNQETFVFCTAWTIESLTIFACKILNLKVLKKTAI